MPRVSVLLPVRNGARYVEQAIDSILGQTFEDLQLVVVDDGSEDATPQLLANSAKHDRRLLAVTLAPSGLVAALEAGRRCAKAPYIARMDADDIATNDRLAAQVRYLDEHPEVVAVGGQVYIIDECNRNVGYRRYPTHPIDCRAYLAFGSPFCHPAVMLRADAVERCGGYRDIYKYAEDFDLWLRLAKVGQLANLDYVVIHYREHQSNLTAMKSGAYAAATALYLAKAEFGVFGCLVDIGTSEHARIDWRQTEGSLPSDVRLFARAAYLRALCLNGGIVGNDEKDLLFESLTVLIDNAKKSDSRQILAFALVRGAYQFFRAKKPNAAIRLLFSAMLRMPRANAVEFGRIVTRRATWAPAVARH